MFYGSVEQVVDKLERLREDARHLALRRPRRRAVRPGRGGARRAVTAGGPREAGVDGRPAAHRRQARRGRHDGHARPPGEAQRPGPRRDDGADGRRRGDRRLGRPGHRPRRQRPGVLGRPQLRRHGRRDLRRGPPRLRRVHADDDRLPGGAPGRDRPGPRAGHRRRLPARGVVRPGRRRGVGRLRHPRRQGRAVLHTPRSWPSPATSAASGPSRWPSPATPSTPRRPPSGG